jgi:hypothetical protein
MPVTRLRSAVRFALTVSATLALVALQAGCDRGPTAPTSLPQVVTPPPPPPPPPPPTPVEFSLSGAVFDNVSRPLEGARVEVVEGPGLGVCAVTNASGNYALPGVYTKAITVRASKPGYGTHTTTVSPTEFWPSSEFKRFFTLDSPSVDLTGDYTLTVTADPKCSEFPPAAQSRTYQATMTPVEDGANRYFIVLSGARFYSFYNRIYARVAGDDVVFDINPYDDMAVTEELTPTTVLSFSGQFRAKVGAASLSIPFDGLLEYCADYRGGQFTFPWFQCSVPLVDCPSMNHRITLTRR